MAPHRAGSVRQRSRGRWQARHQTPNGRTHSQTFDTRREAERWIAAETVDRAAGRWTDRRDGRVSLAAWSKQWLAHAELRPSSRARAQSALTTAILPALGSVAIGDLTTAAVREWLTELSASHLAPATVERHHRVLSSCLQVAANDRLVPSNVARGVKAPAVPRSEMRFLTPAEIARPANSIDPRYRSFILLGAYAGLRMGEMSGLRVGRVDATLGTVRVAEQLVEVAGRLHQGPPKTRAGTRTVSVPRYVLDALPLEGRGPDELVFTAPKGGPLRRTLFASRYFRPAAARANLAGLRIHDLRHTAVALWIAAGASPLECAARAGHTSVSVILDRYGHVFPDAYRATTDRLDAMARGST